MNDGIYLRCTKLYAALYFATIATSKINMTMP